MLSFPFPTESNGYNTALIDRLPVALLFFDEQNCLLVANQAALILFGRPLKELIGQPARGLCPPIAELLDGTALDKEVNGKIICQGPLQNFNNLRVYLAPVQTRTSAGNRLVILWNSDDPAGSYRSQPGFTLMDIPSTAMFESILESIRHGILVTDQAGRVIYHNPSLRVLLEMDAPAFEASGLGWPVLLSRRLKNPERLIRLTQAVQEQPSVEMYDFLELGDGRVLECHSRLQYPLSGSQGVRVWSFEDITEQQRTERELHYLSTHDGLTGLYNRAYFEMQLRQLYTYPAFPASMIMVDVDGLKKINDRYGHPAGDNLLGFAADVLRRACRAEDVVARLGGDEFGILLLRASSEVADTIVDRIFHLQTLQRINHPDLPLSLSVGAATARSNAELVHLFSRADAEMYRLRRRKRASRLAPRPYIRKNQG